MRDGDGGTMPAAHLFWIGGSPGAGKTTVARALALRCPVRAYHFDQQERAHIERRLAAPTAFPALSAFMAMSIDERWVLRSPDAMLASTVASWEERFGLVLEDLAMQAEGTPIIVEGSGLFPRRVAPLLPASGGAIWLVPTPAFLRSVREVRNRNSFGDTSDPGRALENVIARDVLLAGYVEREAERCGLRCIRVDGSRSIDEMTELVAEHFGLERGRGAETELHREMPG